MELSLGFKLLLILGLIAGNAFFVASEIALTSARRSRIKQLADEGHRGAQVVRILHNQPERFYSVTQIGITLVSLALGAVGMETLSHMLDPLFEAAFEAVASDSPHAALISTAHTLSYAVGFLVVSFFHVVGGELAPKVYAFHNAEGLSLTVARIINFLYRLLAWPIWLMNKTARGLLWVFGQRELLREEKDLQFSMTEEEIRTILSASEREGAINPEETRMIRRVFDLDDHLTREAMIPRTEIIAVPEEAPVAELLRRFKEVHHERFPIYRKSLDEITGFVSIKEILAKIGDGEDWGVLLERPVQEIMFPPYIVPETKPLSHLLRDFQQQSRYMAVVIDEFGGTAGLITLEDVLEEIVGEYDDEFTRPQRYIKQDDAGGYLIDASIRVSDLEEALGLPFPQEADYVSLAGLIYFKLGRVPRQGDRLELDVGTLEVAEMDRHRITRVRFERSAPARPADEEGAPEGEVHVVTETKP